MKICRPTKQQLEYLAWLDPFFMLDRIELFDGFVLMATEDTTDEETDVPVGLIICTEGEDHLAVEWLYVADGFREQGAGERLLAAVFDLAEENGLSRIAACIRYEYGQEIVCAGAKTYLKDHMFEQEEALPGEWLTDLTCLGTSSYFQNRPDRISEVTSAGIMNHKELKAAVQMLTKGNGTKMLYPLNGEEENLDRRISAFIHGEHGICGGLLIQVVGDTLYPVLLSADSLEDANALIYYALMNAKEKYDGSTRVRVILSDKSLVPLMNRMIPDRMIQTTRMMADADTYQAEKERLQTLTCAEFVSRVDEFIQLEETAEQEIPDTPDELPRAVEDQDLVVTLQQIGESSLLQPDETMYMVTAFEELDLLRIYTILSRCNDIRPCTWFHEDLGRLPITWFDHRLSCCLEKDGELEGLLLIHPDISGQLWVEYMMSGTAKNPGSSISMLKYAAHKALELYQPDTDVVIRRHRPEIALLTEKFFS